MPATKDGRCWACVQRRRWYPEEVAQAEHEGLRHYTLDDRRLCDLPRRGRNRTPEAMREYRQRWADKAKAADPEGWREKRRDAARRRDLAKRYGLTPDELAAILEAQGGHCAICPSTEPGGRHGTWHVDHDHTTGRVRGVLCMPCNLMLGQAQDDPARLRAGATYLEGIR